MRSAAPPLPGAFALVAGPLRTGYGRDVKLLLENLPPSLREQRETLARCLTAMDAALPLQSVVLFRCLR